MPEFAWPYQFSWPHLLAGAALCLGGWTIYWVGLHLTGAVIGACAGAGAAWTGCALAGLGPGEISWIVPAGGLIGFAVGVFLIRGLHRFFFFVAGALAGMAVALAGHGWAVSHLDWAARDAALWRVVFPLFGCAVGGMAMVYGSRWVVALVTSAAGSAMIVLAFDDPLALIAFPPLVLGSFFLQIGLLRRVTPARRPQRREDEAEPH
jgi:hypothetical protein